MGQTSKTYRSGLEAKVGADLEARGVSFEYEVDKIPYTIEYKYITDFKLPNGIYIETKGYFEYDDRRKHIAMKEQYPDLDVRFVFSKADSKVQGAKMTCREWCEKHGFQWAEGSVPQDWIDE